MNTEDVLDHPDALSDIYRNRFNEAELQGKQILWATLCQDVFQAYVPRSGTVLDLGAGNCEFTNNIEAKRRIALDLNPATASFAARGVEFLRSPSTDLSALRDGTVDTVFTSNFFEHLPSKKALLDTLQESRRVLAPGGRIVVLMPNIRHVNGRYWDYLDHYLPLTHLSLSEALELAGFDIERVVPKFLPYTVKDARVPVSRTIIRLYIKFRPAWSILGRQMLVVARKPGLERSV